MRGDMCCCGDMRVAASAPRHRIISGAVAKKKMAAWRGSKQRKNNKRK